MLTFTPNRFFISPIFSRTPLSAPSAGMSRLTVPPARPRAARSSAAVALPAATSMPPIADADRPRKVALFTNSSRLIRPVTSPPTRSSVGSSPSCGVMSFMLPPCPEVVVLLPARPRRPDRFLLWLVSLAPPWLADSPREQLETGHALEGRARDRAVVLRVVARAPADVGHVQGRSPELHVADVVAEPLQQALLGAVRADDTHAAGQHGGDVEVAVRGRLEPVGDRGLVLEDAEIFDLPARDDVAANGARERLDPDHVAVRFDGDAVRKGLADLGHDASGAVGVEREDVARRRRRRAAEAAGGVGEVQLSVGAEREVVRRAQRDALDLRGDHLDLALGGDALDRRRALVACAPLPVDAAVLGDEQRAVRADEDGVRASPDVHERLHPLVGRPDGDPAAPDLDEDEAPVGEECRAFRRAEAVREPLDLQGGRFHLAHCPRYPSSTASVCPVTFAAPSPARKIAAATSSSGWISGPSIRCWMKSVVVVDLLSARTFFSSGVSQSPGAIALTRTRPFHSSANDLVAWTTPPLLHRYALACG